MCGFLDTIVTLYNRLLSSSVSSTSHSNQQENISLTTGLVFAWVLVLLIVRMSESDFIDAANKGDLNTVQSLVDKVNVNSKGSDGCTALWNAAFAGHLDVVKFLVARKDVDVNLASVRTKDCHHLMNDVSLS